MAGSINVLQWNMRSFSANKADLIYLLNKYDIHVALIMETWLKKHQVASIADYNLVRKDRQDRRCGGVAILIRQDFYFSTFPEDIMYDTELEVTAVSVDVRGKKIIFASVYGAPNIKINLEDLQHLIPLNKDVIIGGDFNSHNPLWGSNRDDGTRSSTIIEYLDHHQLVTLNSGAHTRFQAPEREPSCIDLTFSTGDLAFCSNWEVLQDSHGSDHYPILITIDPIWSASHVGTPLSLPSEDYRVKGKWKTRTADWSKFKEIVATNLSSSPQLDSVQAKYDHLYTSLEGAAEASMKRSTGKGPGKRGKMPVWWDEDCFRIVKQRKKSMKEYDRSSSYENYLSTKRQVATAKRDLTQKRRSKWREFAESLGSEGNLNSIWQKTKAFRNKLFRPAWRFRGQNPPWIPQFLDKYAEDNTVVTDTLEDGDDELSPGNLDEPYTSFELEKAIEDSKKDTAPGEDGHPYSFFCQSPSIFRIALLDLYNDILSSGVLPYQWRSHILIPILKPGKNPEEAASYRPIAKMSCYLKIFQRMIKNRLEWFLEHHELLPPHQMGFRKGRGTVDTVLTLTSDIQLALANKLSTYALFIDINAAYDNVNIRKLNKTLKGLDIGVLTRRLIFEMFSNRMVKVEYAYQYSTVRTSSKGLPQGSILSPILFNVYTIELHNSLKRGVQILQYADDIVLYHSNSTLQVTKENLQSAVEFFVPKLQQSDLSISPTKSQLCIFTRSRINILEENNSLLQIDVGGQTIQAEAFVKYLGMWLDYKLMWVTHIKDLVRRIEMSLNLLRALCGTWWGASPSTLLVLYRSLIRSKIDYGGVLYMKASKTLLEKINVVHRRALRICIGAMISTRKEFLLSEAGEIPLDLRRELMADKFYIKVQAISAHPLFMRTQRLQRQSTLPYWSNRSHQLLQRLPELSQTHTARHLMCFNTVVPLTSMDFTDLIDLDTGRFFQNIDNLMEVRQEFLRKLNTDWRNGAHIYVDGSKMEEGVGAAYLHPAIQAFKMIKLPGFTSIFSAELIALSQALSYTERISYPIYYIFSDSLSALKALMTPKATSNIHPVLVRVLQQLHHLREINKSVRIIWIPGHHGIPGNEAVDILAKRSVVDGIPSPICPPGGDVLPSRRSFYVGRWKERFQQIDSNNDYLKIKDTPLKAPWFSSCRDSRRMITTITRLRLGHCCSEEHLFRLHLIPENRCPYGDGDGSVHHKLFRCKQFQRGRAKLIEEVRRKTHRLPSSVADLIQDGDLDIYRQLFTYLKEHQLYL